MKRRNIFAAGLSRRCFFCSAAALTVTVAPDHATGQFSVLVDGRGRRFVADEIEQGRLPAGSEHIQVGPDSPYAELRKLRAGRED